MDSGRFECAQILTMQEDVPASVFTSRQLAQSSRARAFAPLADQRWVTASIAFLKELDTNTTKRSELLSGQGLGSTAGSGPGDAQKLKTKGSPKKKGRGKREFSEGCRGGGSSLNHFSGGRAVDLLSGTMTFQQWAMSLPRWVLASRTDFARHLAASFCFSAQKRVSAFGLFAGRCWHDGEMWILRPCGLRTKVLRCVVVESGWSRCFQMMFCGQALGVWLESGIGRRRSPTSTSLSPQPMHPF